MPEALVALVGLAAQGELAACQVLLVGCQVWLAAQVGLAACQVLEALPAWQEGLPVAAALD